MSFNVYVHSLKITPSDLSTWSAVNSCNCDRQLIITSIGTFVSGSNFDPDVLFRPLLCHERMR